MSAARLMLPQRRTLLCAPALLALRALAPLAAALPASRAEPAALPPGASSSDGLWRLLGHAPAQPQPFTLQLFDAAGRRVKTWVSATRSKGVPLHVAAIANAGTRRSFIVALHDVPELWEISYDPHAEDIHTGLVHDYRMGESLPVRGYLNIRRTVLEAPVREPHFDADFTHLIAALPDSPAAAPQMAQIVNLDVRRRIATVPVTGALGPGRVEAALDGRGWVWVVGR